MKSSKQTFIVLSAVALVALALTGCGKSDDTTDAASPSAAAPGVPKSGASGPPLAPQPAPSTALQTPVAAPN